jgi:hypothetical protein
MAAMALTASSASADNSHPLQFSFGAEGPSSRFSEPSGIAIDEANGNVVVADGGNNDTLDIVGPEGGPPSGVAVAKIGGFAWGAEPSGVAVDNSPASPSQGDLYVTNLGVTNLGPPSFRKYALNPSGEEYEFLEALSATPPPGEPLGIAVDSKGNVFASDWATQSVVEFSPAGAEIGRIDVSSPVGSPSAVALDSKGDLYVQRYGGGAVYKYAANGSGEIEPATVPTLLVEEGATGVGVDRSTDTVYVAMGDHVAQYSSAGALEGEFGYGVLGSTRRVAIDSAGRIYVTEKQAGQGTENGQVVVFGAAGIPSVATGAATGVESATATLDGTVGPDEVALSDCRFEFVTATAFAARGFEDLSSGGTVPCEPAFGSIPADSAQHPVTASVGGLTPGTPYRFRLVAANANGTNRGSASSFKTFGPPAITDEHTISGLFSEATVGARVNPEGLATTYHVEYGTDTSYGLSTPETAIGSDETAHPVSVALSGLAPGTVYHWRLVAVNSVGTTPGPDRTFATFATPGANEACPNQVFRTAASAKLADCRAYEMVSPVDKNNTDIVSLINIDSHPVRLDQSSTDGEKLTYTTSQGFGDAQSAPYVSQYIASRGADGWSNHGISPPQGVNPIEIGHRIDLEFRAFSPDLCSGFFVSSTEPAPAPGAVKGFKNLYQRENCGEEGLKTLSTEAPGPGSDAGEYEPRVEGVTVDGRCTVFVAFESPQPLYESCGGHLHLVSVLPDGGATTGTAGTLSGINSSPRLGTVARSVSADGSRVYWTNSPIGPGTLYLRINADRPQSAIGGGECTEADKACTLPVSETVSSAKNAHFWSASPDGSKALFTIENGSSPFNSNLYEFDLASGTSTLIAGGLPSYPLGVLGASEDASRVVFPSKEVLTGANAQGKSPLAGAANLYLFDSSKTGADRFRFIGTLSSADLDANANLSAVKQEVGLRISRISPDGRHLAFMSNASLTGYDNTDAESGKADSEIYAYDATADNGEGVLRCVSCNPSGQRPTLGREIQLEGHGGLFTSVFLPPAETELYGSRIVSDDGKRVFFDSYEALIPRDTNGKADVYQWEAAGSGDCSEASPAYSPLNGGCVTLISSGESPADSEFVDASPDGRDVFFTTDASLLPQDPGLVDIYDARAGGGYPPPATQAAACEGEACQGPLAPPNDPTPASSAFEGAGNLKQARKKKRHSKKAQHKKKNANNNRRAAR